MSKNCFVLIVNNVFHISGRGTVASGFLASGRIAPQGDAGRKVFIHYPGENPVEDELKGIEAYCIAGSTVAAAPCLGILLKHAAPESIKKGSVIFPET